MYNTSSFGTKGNVVASKTFPQGFPLSAFADDADPLDSPDLQVADAAVGVNGDMITWSRPGMIEITIAVIFGSVDDQNLDALLDANRVAKGKSSANDVVSVTYTYPSGMTVNMGPGIIKSGVIVPKISAQGRVMTRHYTFQFEQITKSGQSQTASV